MSTSPSSNWLQRLHPARPTLARLVCFPYAGGGASAFRTWGALFPASIELLAVQLPGREQRFKEAPLTAVADIIAQVVHAWQPFGDRPFAFFGHSMGAMLAFESAHRLAQLGRPGPLHLFVSGCRAPQQMARDEPIHHLPDEAFTHAVIERYQGIPAVIQANAELLALLLPTLRADMTVCETYQYRPQGKLACPITALGGRRDSVVLSEDLTLWETHTQRTFQQFTFDGDHFFFQDAQRPIAHLITQTLMAALRGGW